MKPITALTVTYEDGTTESFTGIGLGCVKTTDTYVTVERPGQRPSKVNVPVRYIDANLPLEPSKAPLPPP